MKLRSVFGDIKARSDLLFPRPSAIKRKTTVSRAVRCSASLSVNAIPSAVPEAAYASSVCPNGSNVTARPATVA